MNDLYSIVGVALGLMGIISLFVAAWKFNRPKPTLAEGLVTFLTAAALSAGVKVCVLAFDKKALIAGDSERLYVFLGGLAVIWISADAVWKILTEQKSNKANPADAPKARAAD